MLLDVDAQMLRGINNHKVNIWKLKNNIYKAFVLYIILNVSPLGIHPGTTYHKHLHP